MVSNRCKTAVKEILLSLQLHPGIVDLGEVEVKEHLSAKQRTELKTKLLEKGFDILEDRRSVLIEKIKNTVVQMVHQSSEGIKVNFSHFLSEKLHYDYTYLSNLFSEIQGTTIEQYLIKHKIERIKELITYGEMNMSEIAWKLHYSSVSHLSNQFKKVTGESPSHFKQQKKRQRNLLEDI